MAVLQNTTLQDFQQYYAAYLAPASQQRRKLCVHILPSKEQHMSSTAMHVDEDKQQKQQAFTVQSDIQQQQQQHVQHAMGVVSHPAHHVAAGVIRVHAGAASGTELQEQQQQDEEPDAVSPVKSPKAKRRRQQQHHLDSKGAPAASSLPADLRVQVVEDIDTFKQQCERYPVYQTVKPLLISKQ